MAYKFPERIYVAKPTAADDSQWGIYLEDWEDGEEVAEYKLVRKGKVSTAYTIKETK